MANHLDLEEQEQLDALKHFWARWGNLITGLLIVVLGAVTAWNGYQYWQRSQASKAAALYDEVERAAAAGDAALVERSFTDIRDKFGSTTYAQQAGLLAAKVLENQKNQTSTDAAKQALAWVAEKSSDRGYQAVARLRLAGVLVQAKEYDQALQQLQAPFPKEFEALAADRRGDVLALQGKKNEAVAAYTTAYQKMTDRHEYRPMVEIKLNALGVDPKAGEAAK